MNCLLIKTKGEYTPRSNLSCDTLMPRINKEYREEAKKKIIAAALDVAATEGWERVTLEAIAQKVGVTKGAFYSYYPNSTVLMQEVVVEMIRSLRDQMLHEGEDIPDIHEKLDQVSDFIFLKIQSLIPVFFQAISSSITKDPVFKEKLGDLLDENTAIIIAVLKRYQDAGQIPKQVNLPAAVRAIYGMSIGLGVITKILGKDARENKQAWMEATRKILMLEP
jgi:AcrR family transcriptional regulator